MKPNFRKNVLTVSDVRKMVWNQFVHRIKRLNKTGQTIQLVMFKNFTLKFYCNEFRIMITQQDMKSLREIKTIDRDLESTSLTEWWERIKSEITNVNIVEVFDEHQ